MAQILDSFPPRDSAYPWAEWFDGKIRRLEGGIDFRCSARSMRDGIRRAAREMGIRFRAVVYDKDIILCAELPAKRSRTPGPVAYRKQELVELLKRHGPLAARELERLSAGSHASVCCALSEGKKTELFFQRNHGGPWMLREHLEAPAPPPPSTLQDPEHPASLSEEHGSVAVRR